MSFDFEPVYPHHDMLIELAEVEMAMDRLGEQNGHAGAASPAAELVSRLSTLRAALDELPV